MRIRPRWGMGLKRVSRMERRIASGGKKPLGDRKALAEDTPIAFRIWRMLMGSVRHAMSFAVLALLALPATALAQAPDVAPAAPLPPAPAPPAAPVPAPAPPAAPAPVVSGETA